VVGRLGLKWLVDHNALAKERLEEYYSSYVAGIFRTLRFGTGEAHGRAEMMEFNYLQENRALAQSGGRYTIDDARMPVVLAQLAKELLTIEATGDRARAESWFAKCDQMPAELKTALAATSGIPVDVLERVVVRVQLLVRPLATAPFSSGVNVRTRIAEYPHGGVKVL